MNTIIYFFFRLLRKFNHLTLDFFARLRLSYLYYISKGRIRIHSTTKAARGFSVNTDLTNTNITIHEQVRVRNDFNITMGCNGTLSIGKNCFFNNQCSVNCLGKIEIGENCQFGENVLVYDHNHRYTNKTKLVSEQGYDIGHVKIGNNCWVGSNVVILKGVEIGDNVVIGAGCVIYKSITSDTVVYHQQNLISKTKSSLNE